jgi:histidyl-tRNA synthetase
MACHQKEFPSIKRYHIGKVYRRDNPQMNRGRFREFYQCDFDIAGPSYGKMIPDAEVLKVVVEILSSLKIGGFNIKLNHRKLLDATVSLAGIPMDKFKIVCSSVDKLDKEPWNVVEAELLDKGLNNSQTDNLWRLVQLKDTPWKLLEVLDKDDILNANQQAKETLQEMRTLFEYLDILNITDKFTFDLSLARGLDYYTGLIYEAVLTDTDRVGSIAGGGRYDELLGMFSGKPIPSVGVSIGIERIFNILEENLKNDPSIRKTETLVLVTSIGKNLAKERFRIVNELWEQDIKAEILYQENIRNEKAMDYAVEHRIPFMVFIGENELKEGKVNVKCMANHKQIPFDRKDYIDGIRSLMKDESLLVVLASEKKEEEKRPAREEKKPKEKKEKTASASASDKVKKEEKITHAGKTTDAGKTADVGKTNDVGEKPEEK